VPALLGVPEVPRDPQSLLRILLDERMRGEELDDLDALRGAAPRAEAKALLDLAAAARARRHCQGSVRRQPDLRKARGRTPSHGPDWGARSYSRHAMAGAGRDERAWVRGAQAGSASDFEALFRAHWPRAYRAAYLVVHDAAAAEDLAQEAFLAATRALDRFDSSRPFGPWLHRIVVNRAIDWARARALRREVGAGEAVETFAAEERGDPAAPLPDDVVAALASLSPDHRAVVVLRYVLEYTPGEIARMLELPRGTVNSRLRRGLDALQGAVGRPEER
jgi:RNA polymerase sigma-70 factor (ECF subfamily)